MRRRDFVTLLGGAVVAWPLTARAQQPALPVVGLVNGSSLDASARDVAEFRKGLNETGYVEGQNVTVEYHWLEGRYDRLTALMADLVRRRVAVIATPGTTPGTIAAKPPQRRSRSSSVSPKIRSSSVLSPASPGRAATRREAIFSARRWWPSDCSSCMNWCPRLFVSRCSSTRPTLRPPSPRRGA